MEDKKEKSILFLILSILSILPAIFYPLVIFASFFLFDDPNANLNLVGLLFILSWTYPFILLFNLWVAFKIYNTKKKLAHMLVCWPIVIIMYFCISIYY